MPTASIAGYNGVFYVSPDNGSTWHTVGELKDVQIEVDTDMMDATTHASAGVKEYVPGNTAWKATAKFLSVYADAGQADISAALSPKTKLKFRFDPVGTTVGKPRREGFGFIQNWKEADPTTDLVASDISIQGTAALAFSTQ